MKIRFSWVGVAWVMGIAGCGSSADEELTQWMTDQRNSLTPVAQPVTEPKKFQPENYSSNDKLEPFSVQKLTMGMRSDASHAVMNTSLIGPELARRKEYLETFPLDTMSLVGSLLRDGQKVALVRVDKMLYQVRAGAYLGQNFGKVLSVSEGELVLREIVQDTSGDWIERKVTLLLQGENKQ
ncbi:MAG: pilus assembly protein PilP [Polaromonas sp.]|nr:pilus assembly protein PilP [Polaromonas sp.]